MEFWSRLIGGAGSSSNRSQSSGPEERLLAFKRACTKIHQIWRNGVALSQDEAAALNTQACLDRINTLLAEESRAPVPHPCLAFASNSHIYVHATRLAISSFDSGLIRSATVLMNSLLDNDDEIAANHSFARALVNLAGRGGASQSWGLGEEEDAYLVELLFGIANKIRLQPDILPAWFSARSLTGEKAAEEEFAGTVRRDEFPLFYLLMDYVHHDGRAGDFARTGLLYIIETASESKDLERWLIESDLATLMASGLGAMYSQLSRKLTYASFGGPLPAIIALSDPDVNYSETRKTDSQVHMDAFLSYLMFWQDTLEHCKSAEVKDTLLDHFQILFLQQLLYPSLIESSDVDGGSTFSVLTYLSCILDAVDHPDLIRRILEYLLASPPLLGVQRTKTPKSRMSLSRRKSLDMLTVLAEADDNPSPTLFNLVDLISLSLRSKNKTTIAAVLKLLSIILRKHHQYALSSLFKPQPRKSKPKCTIAFLDEWILLLFNLATDIDGTQPVDESYEQYVKDASHLLESHPCTTPLLSFKPFSIMDIDAPSTMALQTGIHSSFVIQPDDKTFEEILSLMETFFTNDIMTNLALTETFVGLAGCGLINLEPWLLPMTSQQLANDIGLDADAMTSPGTRYRRVKLDEEASDSEGRSAPLLQLLQKHTAQIRKWREEVSGFDNLLWLRKRQLQEPNFPSRSVLAKSREPGTRSDSPTMASFSDVLSPQRTVKIQSRSSSPRGRKFRAIDSSASASEVNSAAPSRSPIPKAGRMGSPLAGLRRDSPAPQESAIEGLESGEGRRPADMMRHNIPLHIPPSSRMAIASDTIDSETSSVTSEPTDNEKVEEDKVIDISINHILTNTIILREFILEIAAVVQVRTGLLGEVVMDER